jgi:uncharacterized protein (TIGR00725 family)
MAGNPDFFPDADCDNIIKTSLHGKRIGVIGAGICDKKISEIAYKVGELIARNRAYLYCGGLGGVMRAASKGAYEHNGITIGILPGKTVKDANPYIKIPVITCLSYMRNFVLVNSCELLIAISGVYGTLSELSFALKLEKPVVGIKTWENFPAINYVDSPEEAINKAIEILSSDDMI